MGAVTKQLKSKESLVSGQERLEAAEAAIRRAMSFPVKGGDFVRVERKSWYKPLQQKPVKE